MPYPDYLKKNPRIIFFTDFDGTITRQDCCDWLVETEGYGPEKLRQSCRDIVEGKLHFGEGLRDQLDSIKTPFNKCVERLLDHIELDEYFAAFYQWTVSVSIPVIVLSAGITSMIHAVLAKLLGPEAENIEVIANEVVPREGFRSIDEEGGAWKIEFRDDSSYGHDKARTIRPYAISRDCMKGGVRPLLLFAGDGVSDLSAAKETELLFAKEGEDLVTYCKRNHLPFVPFRDFKSILDVTQSLYCGQKTVDEILKLYG